MLQPNVTMKPEPRWQSARFIPKSEWPEWGMRMPGRMYSMCAVPGKNFTLLQNFMNGSRLIDKVQPCLSLYLYLAASWPLFYDLPSSVHLSTSNHPANHPSVHPIFSVCLSVYPSTYPSTHLSIYLLLLTLIDKLTRLESSGKGSLNEGLSTLGRPLDVFIGECLN